MRRSNVLCFLLWITTILRIQGFVAAEADPAILSGTDLAHFQQSHPSHDPRPRLSASQQAQILSDVQQHQQRFRRPQDGTSNPRGSFDQIASKPQTSASYSSLAKYKVDRAKQQQLQQLYQQQQQVQQLIQEQQQKIAQQLSNPSYLNTQAQFQSQPAKQQQQQQQQFPQQFGSQYQNINGHFQNLQQDLSQPLFSDRQTLQLQEYLEKQRELELLQKQRQQLLLEQQELRRQQELLRLQQLQKLTSTTPPPPPPVTSPSTISVSTTASPVLVSLPTRKITPSETDLFLKAIATHQKKYSTTTPISPTTTTTPRTTTTSKPTIVTPVSSKAYQERATSTSAIPENLLSLIQEQQNQFAQQGKPKPQIKVIYQTEKPGTSRSTTPKTRSASLGSERDVLLKQLKLALAQSVDDDIRNVSTRDIVLPNGKKIQFIDSSSSLTSNIPADGSILTTSTLALTTSTTTIKPPKAILEELTKGVLPPGADFEVIRQKSDGRLEEIGKAPIQSLPAKKVTFVVLEEQPDGSYKVQGVKGNAEKEGSEVESIVEKIKKGELKLPPSSSSPTTLSSLQSFPSSLDPNSISTRQGVASTTSRSTAPRSTSISSRYTESKPTEHFPHVTVSPNSVSTTDKYLSSASSVTNHVFNSLGPVSTSIPKLTSSDQDNRATSKYPSVTRNHFIPTMAPVNEIITTTPASVPTTFSHHSTNSYIHLTARPPGETSPTLKTAPTTTRPSTTLRNDNIIYQDSFERSTISPTIEPPSTRSQTHESLITLLRREGLFAMAKYLRQSGLDNVLNETGPYTIFVPTDKAFRTLLVQLGGPEKAEQKFRDNPRLLSGLLLHHVIPGAFRIDSLQDEMTGVSLAGTQLRVNEYAMHDHEWNDIKVTTINGAKVASTKRDIEIPQGIAHAIDRVMFPLPVGDLVQTLQADRERRFTTFLKMLYTSGLQDTLAGPKTFTVFAPTDSAFESFSKDGAPVWTEEDGPEAAKMIISRHVIPSTLYTAGMRYYLQKDTLRPQSPIHIHKNGGRVRVNEVHVVTHNIPATNGVLHAIDGIL
ncbi:hypothetical protein QLX08_007235 [Tetragonisca angustula]|uniref:FAS1 domain-containing protein n=1 Tax=Tetragonisca angustula TaxID=166442 RepID=A0AAW0ZQ33_9HYME